MHLPATTVMPASSAKRTASGRAVPGWNQRTLAPAATAAWATSSASAGGRNTSTTSIGSVRSPSVARTGSPNRVPPRGLTGRIR